MEPKGYYDPLSERELKPEEWEEFLERISHPGIHITSITPPAQGWPIATYCPICKETTFILSPWANKPADGDYFKMNDTCARLGVADQHNIQIASDKIAARRLAIARF